MIYVATNGHILYKGVEDVDYDFTKEEIRKKWKKDDLLPSLVDLCKNLIDLCNGAYGSGIDDETQTKIDELKIAFDLDLE